jgi:hypothetical protein
MTFRSKFLGMLVMFTVSMQLVTICDAQTKSEPVTIFIECIDRRRYEVAQFQPRSHEDRCIRLKWPECHMARVVRSPEPCRLEFVGIGVTILPI